MNSMCFKCFESVQTTKKSELLGSFTRVQYVSKVSNLFESNASRSALLGTFTWIWCVSRVSNLFKPLADQHYKVVSHELNVFCECWTSLNHLWTRYISMNSRCFERFECVQTTSRSALLLGSFTWIRCVSKVSNLFKPLEEHHRKVVSHEFSVCQKYRICSNI